MYTMIRLDADSAQEFARDFEDVFYEGNCRDMASAYTADGKLFAEGAAVVEGRPAIEEFWKQACERGQQGGMRRSIQFHEACASGDLGYTHSTVTLQLGGDPAKIAIRDVCVWRRESDGIWRIAYDISSRG
jgi:ketosteroid isomerase-like protein